MIRFTLRCTSDDHRFEVWFRNGETCDTQLAEGLIHCPLCNGTAIEKALMAPAVQTAERQREARMAMVTAAVRDAVREVKSRCDDVGEQFPEVARQMHYGETDERPIWGLASRDDADALVEEGIQIAALPDLPEPDA